MVTMWEAVLRVARDPAGVIFSPDPMAIAAEVRALAETGDLGDLIVVTDLSNYRSGSLADLTPAGSRLKLLVVDDLSDADEDTARIRRLAMQGACAVASESGAVIPVIHLHRWSAKVPDIVSDWCKANDFGGVHLFPKHAAAPADVGDGLALYLEASLRLGPAVTVSEPFARIHRMIHGLEPRLPEANADAMGFESRLVAIVTQTCEAIANDGLAARDGERRDTGWTKYLHPLARPKP